MLRKKDLFNRIHNNMVVEEKPVREFYDNSSERLRCKAEHGVFLQEDDIKRILVNSIRHTGSTYDRDMKIVHQLDRRIPGDTYYKRYKNMVLNEIAEKYPFLKDECENQKYKIQMVRIVK